MGVDVKVPSRTQSHGNEMTFILCLLHPFCSRETVIWGSANLAPAGLRNARVFGTRAFRSLLCLTRANPWITEELSPIPQRLN